MDNEAKKRFVDLWSKAAEEVTEQNAADKEAIVSFFMEAAYANFASELKVAPAKTDFDWRCDAQTLKFEFGKKQDAKAPAVWLRAGDVTINVWNIGSPEGFAMHAIDDDWVTYSNDSTGKLTKVMFKELDFSLER